MAGGWQAGGNMHDILETCITTGINCIRERLINRNCSSPNTQREGPHIPERHLCNNISNK